MRSNLWDAERNGTATLIAVTHYTASTVRGATYGMQNAIALQHSCLVVVTHETSSPLRGGSYGMQNVISSVPATQNGTPTSTSKHATVANPSSRAMAPEKCHFSSQIKRQKMFRKYCASHEIYKTPQTVKHKTQRSGCKQT